MLTVSPALGRSQKWHGGGAMKDNILLFDTIFSNGTESLSDSSEDLKCFVQAHFLNQRQSFFKQTFYFL